MDMMFNEMNKTDALHEQKHPSNNNLHNKPSLGAKSMPVGKQSQSSKLNDFCSKFTEPPTKVQPAKQANLLGFFGKKK